MNTVLLLLVLSILLGALTPFLWEELKKAGELSKTRFVLLLTVLGPGGLCVSWIRTHIENAFPFYFAALGWILVGTGLAYAFIKIRIHSSEKSFSADDK